MSTFITASLEQVQDPKTNLIWSTGYFEPVTHADAIRIAASQSGWRLPTVEELFALADRSRMSPTLDPEVFLCPKHDAVFWSSTKSCYSPLDIWAVDFEYGYGVIKGRAEKHYVRLVRE